MVHDQDQIELKIINDNFNDNFSIAFISLKYHRFG